MRSHPKYRALTNQDILRVAENQQLSPLEQELASRLSGMLVTIQRDEKEYGVAADCASGYVDHLLASGEI